MTNDYREFQNFLSNEKTSNGYSNCGDWVGAYNLALNDIIWREGTRLIIHIADAPANGHNEIFCNIKDNYNENKTFYSIIDKCMKNNIKIGGFQIVIQQLIHLQSLKRNIKVMD